MDIAVEDNPNCEASPQLVFREIGEPRLIRGLIGEEGGREVRYEITGVGEGGAFVPARAVKVADSGEGFAYLIYGGEWGLRLRPEGAQRPWSLEAGAGWGEPFKLYGSEADILYADGEKR